MKTHIQLANSANHSLVIACGAPERAAWFASKLEGSEALAKNREYHSYLGRHRGKPILVISHGVGAAGAGICFQELIDAGAKAIVRIGTAGGFYSGAKIGDIVVPSAAVRNDGLSSLMIPPQYPAVADLKLAGTLVESIGRSGQVESGIILTTDLFYAGKLASDSALYKEAGVKGVEMECSALFVIAQLRGIRAAAALVLDGSPLDPHADSYDPRPERLAQSMERCFAGAVDSLFAVGE
ncbi:MAG: purine-nucleoside phosphorylase [Oligoflexia bacterium]|nr:purine-nucleoside phosphorylase [Oligoflexia bacterium]